MRSYLLSICLCLSGWVHGQSVCSQEQAEVIIEILTDRYGYETSWALTGSAGTRYAAVAPFTYKNQRLYRDTLCIPKDSCTTFTIYDAFGDGISAPGYYLVLLDGDTLARGGAFQVKESTHLECSAGEICELGTPVTPGTYVAKWEDTWYQFTPQTTGSYRISTRNLNTCDTKIWVYPSCTGITIAQDNQSTVFFNDNATLQILQAEVKGYFQAGKTYWIRIGDNNDACTDSIRWKLTFEGPIRGCMDPNSCNYNPLATVDDGSCLPKGDFRCPKEPDLLIRQDTLLSSLRLDTIHSEDACLIQEGCVRGYGVRQVLRFTTQIQNVGERDYYIGTPSLTNSKFTWNNCHNHFHYDGYAEYLVVDEWGKKMPIGFKSGLCITDFGCEPGYNPKFSCDNMGISAHCYDAYWSELKCQWIDVTDLPDGKYTLVVRINWKNSPDSLGQVEKNLDNNVAQACFRLSRTSGTLHFTMEPSCASYRDCAGTLFGDAQPDCWGVCGGTHLIGDVNENGTEDLADAEKYVSLLLGNDIDPNPCNDLNADGAITVQDAVLLTNCLNFGAAHQHTGAGVHNHCQFPAPNLLNENDTVTLRILNINWNEKYADIGILNQTANITAYQFRVSGGIVSYVENLVDEVSYPITPRTSMVGGMIVGLSYRDSVIHKSALMQPLCRVHFLTFTSKTVQLEEIIAIINSNMEKVITEIDSSRIIPRVIPSINIPIDQPMVMIRPNPFREEAQFCWSGSDSNSFRLIISDINGKIVQEYWNIQPPNLLLQRKNLPEGIYFYKLIGDRSYTTGKFIIK